MAIVQISRITSRKGLTENLPQLAGAELGWCVDSRRLFIGNGTLHEGAPIIGNTEILTEFSDITVLSSYTYQDIAVGYAAQTGPTVSAPIVRSVQSKLDDFADVRDFGAVGDGITDDTNAINRALFQLYCVQANSAVRRSLYFPAGTYLVSSSIIIPAYAKLVGEGADCSIIQLVSASPVDYVAQFGDSAQQTGVNIGNNGATAPRNIEISSMTFSSTQATDLMLVEDATQCYFDSVNFIGPLTTNDIVSNLATDDIAGVRFASTSTLVCNNITFDKCRFSGLTYGISTDQQIKSVTVSNSKFEILYSGIAFGLSTPVNGGPTGFRAVYNMFDQIYSYGISYENVSMNATAHNIFYDVGNEYSGNPVVPVILFGNDNNISIADMFERTDAEAYTVPRINIIGGASDSTSQIQLGHYTRENGHKFSLSNNQLDQTVFVVNSDITKAFQMTYTLVRDTGVRFGTVTVTAQNADDSSLTLSYSEDFTENFDTGVTFSVTQVGTLVSVKYSSTNTGLAGILTYSIAHLA